MLANDLRKKELDYRLQRIPYSQKQNIVKLNNKKEKIHVVYVMTHVAVCGGSKVIFEHANLLTKKGISVTIVSHFEKPTWFDISANYLKVPFGIDLSSGIPLCDVIVATYYDHIQSCIDTGIAPVVYFEQGDIHLTNLSELDDTMKNFIKKSFEIVPFIITVSSRTSEQIKVNFNRDSIVFDNSIDTSMFNQKGEHFSHTKPYMLIMGSAGVPTKKITYCIQAYQQIKKSGMDINLLWISPNEPPSELKPYVDQIFVSPSQEEIASLFRGAALYLSASTVESFSLPCIEAMACGCPVISASNEGVLGYGVNGSNMLICPPNDPEALSSACIKVLTNTILKETLVIGGLSTSLLYNWDITISKLIDFYQEVSLFEVLPHNDLSEFEIYVTEENFQNPSDYERFVRTLKFTSATSIELPVLEKINHKWTNGYWNLAAVKKGEQKYEKIRIYSKLHSSSTPINEHILKTRDLLSKGLYLDAITLFYSLASNETNPHTKFSYYRWIVISYILDQNNNAALEFINQIMSACSDYSDIFYLFLYVLKELQVPVDSMDDFRLLIQTYGESVAYDDFIVDIEYHIDQLY